MKAKLLILIATCLSIILCGCTGYQTPNEANDIEIVNEALLLTGTPVDEVVLSRNSEHIFSSPLNADNFFDIDILGTIPRVEKFQRIEVLDSGWSKVIFNGVTGYVSSARLIILPTLLINDVSEAMYINVNDAPICDVEYPHYQVDILPIATPIQRIGIIGDECWSKIVYNEKEYYVLSECLSYEKPVLYEEVDKTVFASEALTVYSNYKDGEELGTLSWADSIQQIAIGDNGWSKVLYNEQEAFVQTELLAEDIFPIYYEDETCKITITRDWYKKAWCYTAHLEFTDYARFGTDCANGKYNNGYETTSHAAERLNALFAVNGCYSAPYFGYTVVRSGVICNGSGRSMNLPGVYSSHTGLFLNAWGETYGGTKGIVGHNVKKLVEAGTVTDTFCFGPPSLINGKLQGYNSGARAQRTLIGTNGNPGDLWIVVSDGRYNDGESAGLTFYEGAQYLQELGCTFGIHLDGGGSSTMYFNGKVLNAVKGNERAVVDFLYFK